MTSSRRFTSGQSRVRGRGRDTDRQSSAQAAPPVETYSDRKEELSSRLHCVTARDDAFAPAGTLGATHNLRANRSAGGAIPMYSRSSSAARGASPHALDLTPDQRQSWPPKLPAIPASLIASKSARGRGTSAVAGKIAIPAQLRTSKLSPGPYKSASQALALRQMRMKNPFAMWTFQIFTELIPLRLRIVRFIVAG
jgi:hypothetical protein